MLQDYIINPVFDKWQTTDQFEQKYIININQKKFQNIYFKFQIGNKVSASQSLQKLIS